MPAKTATLLTPLRLYQAGAMLLKAGMRTRRTIAILQGTAAPANAMFVKAAESIGIYAGAGVAQILGSVAGSSIKIGGTTIPLAVAGMVAAASVFNTVKHAVRRDWKMAAAELGVGMLEVGINIAFLQINPALGLFVGEGARQGLVEVMDRTLGMRPQNAGLYNLYKTARHGIEALNAKRRAGLSKAFANRASIPLIT